MEAGVGSLQLEEGRLGNISMVVLQVGLELVIGGGSDEFGGDSRSGVGGGGVW